MQIRRLHSLLPLILIVVAVLGIIYRARQVKAEQSHPFGRFTEQQIIARTEPLCRLVAPDITNLRLSAMPRSGQASDGGTERFWCVEYEDATEQRFLCFWWEADTGELQKVCNRLRLPQGARRRLLSRQEATQTAWAWMEALGIRQQAKEWHLREAPTRFKERWNTVWLAEGRRLFFALDAYSGQVSILQSTRLPSVPYTL
jgi:hypothetical protein